MSLLLRSSAQEKVVREIFSSSELDRLISCSINVTASDIPILVHDGDMFLHPDIVVARFYCKTGGRRNREDQDEHGRCRRCGLTEKSFQQSAKKHAPAETPDSQNRESDNIMFVNIDVCRLKEVCDRYKVKVVPTILIIRHGSVLGSQAGFYDESDLISFIDIYIRIAHLHRLMTENDHSKSRRLFERTAGEVKDEVELIAAWSRANNFIGNGIGYFLPTEFPSGHIGTFAQSACFAIELLFSADERETAANSRFRSLPAEIEVPVGTHLID